MFLQSFCEDLGNINCKKSSCLIEKILRHNSNIWKYLCQEYCRKWLHQQSTFIQNENFWKVLKIKWKGDQNMKIFYKKVRILIASTWLSVFFSHKYKTFSIFPLILVFKFSLCNMWFLLNSWNVMLFFN